MYGSIIGCKSALLFVREIEFSREYKDCRFIITLKLLLYACIWTTRTYVTLFEYVLPFIISETVNYIPMKNQITVLESARKGAKESLYYY
jgi:hypothetical protein